MTNAKILSQKIDAGEFLAIPGLYDMISAVIANKVGFDFVYASGYWMTASAYGLPDAGIVSFTQMLDRVAQLCDTADAGVIADADTGFGGLVNVAHTVRGYERAGVAAIQIEDQEFPKKCGHVAGKRVVPVAEMVDRIKVACDTRQDMLVIARTDARQPEDFERAIERAQRYAEAGADLIFVEALESEEEMRGACAAINKPLFANMADGGVTPILSPEQLKDIGYAMAIYPAMSALAAARAVEASLMSLKHDGLSRAPDAPHFSFKEFNELIGFPEIYAFEEKWGRKG
jgi:2-methylisocitrate lyase-like PEP mutase family enzyme